MPLTCKGSWLFFKVEESEELEAADLSVPVLLQPLWRVDLLLLRSNLQLRIRVLPLLSSLFHQGSPVPVLVPLKLNSVMSNSYTYWSTLVKSNSSNFGKCISINNNSRTVARDPLLVDLLLQESTLDLRLTTWPFNNSSSSSSNSLLKAFMLSTSINMLNNKLSFIS